jgi:hypothetical protein
LLSNGSANNDRYYREVRVNSRPCWVVISRTNDGWVSDLLKRLLEFSFVSCCCSKVVAEAGDSSELRGRGTFAVGSRYKATASEDCNRPRRTCGFYGDLWSVVTSCISVQLIRSSIQTPSIVTLLKLRDNIYIRFCWNIVHWYCTNLFCRYNSSTCHKITDIIPFLWQWQWHAHYIPLEWQGPLTSGRARSVRLTGWATPYELYLFHLLRRCPIYYLIYSTLYSILYH